MYQKHRQELVAAGLAPRKRGRPTMYDHGEALEIKRDRAREYAMRSRAAKQRSLLLENDNTISESGGEISD